MNTYTFSVCVTLFMFVVSGQQSLNAQADGDEIEIDSRACNTTTGAGCPPSDSSFPSFLFKLVVIAGSIAGVMVLLSVVACLCHYLHSRKSKGLLEVEAPEFEQSEDPQVHFRRMDDLATNRTAASVFSWGSEFSLDAGRKGNYENPEVIEMARLNRKSNNQIYANTMVNDSVLPQEETSFTNNQASEYANVCHDV